MTQAAASQRIQALEKTLGKSLFDRKGGGVLTGAGRTPYAYAQRIIDLHREVRQEFTGQDAPVAGELVTAASSIPGEHLLPTLLSVFGRKHPHVRVRAVITDVWPRWVRWSGERSASGWSGTRTTARTSSSSS